MKRGLSRYLRIKSVEHAQKKSPANSRLAGVLRRALGPGCEYHIGDRGSTLSGLHPDLLRASLHAQAEQRESVAGRVNLQALATHLKNGPPPDRRGDFEGAASSPGPRLGGAFRQFVKRLVIQARCADERLAGRDRHRGPLPHARAPLADLRRHLAREHGHEAVRPQNEEGPTWRRALSM